MAKRTPKSPKPEAEKHVPEPLQARTKNQQFYISYLGTKQQVFAVGPAGTGKTFIPATLAADRLLEGKISRVILTRPAVSVEEDLGFLPGDLSEKIAPWARAITDVMEARMGKLAFNAALRAKAIEIIPLGMMRGFSFTNAMLICDEAQNTTISQMKMLLTRVGEGTQIVVCGDMGQSDIVGVNGLHAAVKIAQEYDIRCAIVKFGVDDIVRSGICAAWAKAFADIEGDPYEETLDFGSGEMTFSEFLKVWKTGDPPN